jgi:prepilin-type processing-associated H-X9-DG protein
MNRPVLGAFGDPDANFGSDHPSGAHFVFADGSVRFILQVIDLLSYQRLSNKSDGVPVALPE